MTAATKKKIGAAVHRAAQTRKKERLAAGLHIEDGPAKKKMPSGKKHWTQTPAGKKRLKELAAEKVEIGEVGRVSKPMQPASIQKAAHLPEIFEERHFTVAEVAGMWNLSEDTTRRLFENEPGVLSLHLREGKGKRRYRTLRIPKYILGETYRKNLIPAQE